MSLYALKPRFQALLRPLVGRLAASGVTANRSPWRPPRDRSRSPRIVMWNADERLVFLLMPLWLFVRMALNAIDGMLAREFGQKSRLGAYLNEIGDVVSDAALYAPFALRRAVRSARRRGGHRAFGAVGVRRRARPAGRRVAPLRRAAGQERPRASSSARSACWIGVGGAAAGLAVLADAG